MDETSILQNKAADHSVALDVKSQHGLADKSRLRKWLSAIFVLMVLVLASLFFVLRRGVHLPFFEPLSDQVSFLPLVSFEFEEPGFFREWKEHVFNKKTLYTLETVENEKVLHA